MIRANAFFTKPAPGLYPLCGAILRGIVTNCNDVDFALLASNVKEDHIKSQLPQHCWERFEAVERIEWAYILQRMDWIYIKLKPQISTGEVVCVLYQSLCTVSIFSSSSCCRQ